MAGTFIRIHIAVGDDDHSAVLYGTAFHTDFSASSQGVVVISSLWSRLLLYRRLTRTLGFLLPLVCLPRSTFAAVYFFFLHPMHLDADLSIKLTLGGRSLCGPVLAVTRAVLCAPSQPPWSRGLPRAIIVESKSLSSCMLYTPCPRDFEC